MKKLLCIILSVICLSCSFGMNAMGSEDSEKEITKDGIVYRLRRYTYEADNTAKVIDVKKSGVKNGVLKIPKKIETIYGTFKVTALDTNSLLDDNYYFDEKFVHEYRDNIYKYCDKIILPDSIQYVDLEAFGTKEKPLTLVLGKNVKEIYKSDHSHRKTKKQNLFQYIDIKLNNNKYFKIDGDFLIKKKYPKTVYAFLGGKTCKIPSYIKKLNGFKKSEVLKSVEIPKKVTTICAGAFDGCSALKKIVIPKTVKKIGEKGFANCSNVKKITFEKRSSNITLVDPFVGCNKVVSFTVPGKLGSKCYGVCKGMEGLKKVKFASRFDNKYIRNMFQGCKSLESVEIPKSVTYIKSLSFYACESLERIVIPENVVRLGDTAFANCTNLKEVVFEGNKLERIYGLAFDDCKSLEEITIPSSCTKVYDTVFRGCSKLKKVVFEGNVRYVGRHAFQNCESLEEIIFKGQYLDHMLNEAFYNAKSLKRITISNTSKAPYFYPTPKYTSESTFNGAPEGIEFYVKNETVAEKLKANLEASKYTSAKIYISDQAA